MLSKHKSFHVLLQLKLKINPAKWICCHQRNYSKGELALETMGLSTRALKTDSLDPDPRSGFNVYVRKLHTARRLRELHCLTGSHALSCSIAHSSDPDRGHVEAKWSLNPYPWSVSDSDPRCGEPVWRAQSYTIMYVGKLYNLYLRIISLLNKPRKFHHHVLWART